VPARPKEGFEKNVFINCPFDSEYHSLLRPLLFTVIYLGFNPKVALESSDSGELRINKICHLIRESRYSIHDLSRLQSSKPKEFYRLNMPFELGIEYGCRQFGPGYLRTKRCLILEKDRFNYIKALSDLSGVDIKSHDDKPSGVIREVRNWFVETVGLRGVESPQVIWYKFNDFMTDFYTERLAEESSDEDLSMMPLPEFTTFIRDWIHGRPAPR
jgi:hypothetical protein